MGSVLSFLASSLKQQCLEASCLNNFIIENRLLLLSFGLLFLFGCCSSSVLVLFQNLLQLNEEGNFFGAFQFKSCATTAKVLGDLWIMKTGIDRDFSDEITLKKTMCRLKIWKKIENPPPSLP